MSASGMLHEHCWGMARACRPYACAYFALAVPREHATPKPRHAVSITIVVFGDAVCDVRVCEQNQVHVMRPGAQWGYGTSLEGWR